jgi:hypothetical protein
LTVDCPEWPQFPLRNRLNLTTDLPRIHHGGGRDKGCALPIGELPFPPGLARAVVEVVNGRIAIFDAIIDDIDVALNKLIVVRYIGLIVRLEITRAYAVRWIIRLARAKRRPADRAIAPGIGGKDADGGPCGRA